MWHCLDICQLLFQKKGLESSKLVHGRGGYFSVFQMGKSQVWGWWSWTCRLEPFFWLGVLTLKPAGQINSQIFFFFFLGYLKAILVNAHHVLSFYHVFSREVPVYSRERNSGIKRTREDWTKYWVELKSTDDVCLSQRKQDSEWVDGITNILSQKKCSLRNYYWD